MNRWFRRLEFSEWPTNDAALRCEMLADGRMTVDQFLDIDLEVSRDNRFGGGGVYHWSKEWSARFARFLRGEKR